MGCLKLDTREFEPTLEVVGGKYFGGEKSCAGGFRYGFNGQERTDEVYGEGNLNTAQFWEYDTRLARRWNLEPYASQLPSWSPYSTYLDNPVLMVDENGDFPWVIPIIIGYLLSPTPLVAPTGHHTDAQAIQDSYNEQGMWVLGSTVLPIAIDATATNIPKVINAIRNNPITTTFITGTVLSAADPNPAAEYTPGLPGDEVLGNIIGEAFRALLKSDIPKLVLGKGHIIGEYADDINNSYHMFKPGFGIGIPNFSSPSNQIMQAMYKTIDDGGKIVMDLTDVSIDAAKQGFRNFDEAMEAGKITEWELSKILRDNDLLRNTTFHVGGEARSASDLGLEVIQ